MIEQRKYPRINKNIPLKIRDNDYDIVTETENISCNGAYCKIERYIQPMTKLKLTILLPLHDKGNIVTKKIECEGVVVRVVRGSETPPNTVFHIGIFFNNVRKNYVSIISKYIAYHLENPVNA